MEWMYNVFEITWKSKIFVRAGNPKVNTKNRIIKNIQTNEADATFDWMERTVLSKKHIYLNSGHPLLKNKLKLN